jgi:uncharacterized membrane protein YbhN (UPF0104 family)
LKSFRRDFGDCIYTGNIRRYLLFLIQLAITLSLIISICLILDWDRIKATLVSTRVDLLVGTWLCLAASSALGAFNTWILLDGLRKVSFEIALRSYLISWCAFLFLPGSTGDAMQLLFLKEAGVSYRHSGTAYVTDKLITLILTLLLSVVGGLVYFRSYLRVSVLIITAALIVLVVTAVLIAARRTRSRWVLRALDFVSSLLDYSKNHPWRLGLNGAGTAMKMILTGLSHWFTFQAVGTDVSFGIVVTVAFLAGLVAYVPIAFNGVGTVEFAAVWLYRATNVLAHQVLATYLLLRASIALMALIGLLISRFLRARPSPLIAQV